MLVAPRVGVLDHPDILRLFASQHWVANVRQLTGLGVSRAAIHRARQRALLVSPLRGVVAVASVELSFEGRALALQLAADHQAFVSGTSAGVLYGLREMSRSTVEVTVREDRRLAVPNWGRLVKTSWIGPDDVLSRPDGLRVAAPLRMLFRLAGHFNQHRFERAAEDVWHKRLATPAEAAEYLALVRRQGRTGVTRFETWLEKTIERARPSQSGLELDFIELIDRVGLPKPARQHPVVLTSGEVIHLDVAWPEVRLGIEPGHSWWHGGDIGMRNDAARDRASAEVGWHIVRYDETAREDPPGTARQLLALYRERAALFAAARVLS